MIKELAEVFSDIIGNKSNVSINIITDDIQVYQSVYKEIYETDRGIVSGVIKPNAPLQMVFGLINVTVTKRQHPIIVKIGLNNYELIEIDCAKFEKQAIENPLPDVEGYCQHQLATNYKRWLYEAVKLNGKYYALKLVTNG